MRIVDVAVEYPRILAKVRVEGEWVTSRGMRAKEIVGAAIDLSEPTLCWAGGTGRKLNLGIGLAEACQLVAGESYPNLMSKVSNGAFERYKDGDVLHGAYGPRLRPQLETAIRRLMVDEGSRQAVVTIWDPLHDGQERRDLPCTVTMQFMVRGGKLCMLTYMRSNDAWLGLPYDLFQFTQLQCTLAWCLGVPAGTYYHRVGSLHLYEEHVELSKEVFPRRRSVPVLWNGVQSSLSSALTSDPIARLRYARTAADMALQGLDCGQDDSDLVKQMSLVTRGRG